MFVVLTLVFPARHQPLFHRSGSVVVCAKAIVVYPKIELSIEKCCSPIILSSCSTGTSIESLIPQYEDKMYGHLKVDTAGAVVNLLEPIQARFKELRADESALQAIARVGAEKARERAAVTLATVYDRVGFLPK